MSRIEPEIESDIAEAVQDLTTAMRANEITQAVQDLSNFIQDQDLRNEIEELRYRVSGISASVQNLSTPLIIIALSLFLIAAKYWGAPWQLW